MKRPRQAALNNWATLPILIAVSACGGGGGAGDPPPLGPSTLAYVVSECRQEAGAANGTIRQRLEVRQGDHAPITVADTSVVEFASVGGICQLPGVIRRGPAFAEYGVFRRLGVTPDGSQVVFEVTDEVAEDPLVFPRNALPAEQTGIFVVRADGTDVPRRVGPASRVGSSFRSFFVFSPSGRTIAYTDFGPSSDNQDAVQIFTLDLATRERRQVTELPPASGGFEGTYYPFFNDEQTITFFTRANADGNHPGGERIVVTIKTDGTGLTVAPPAVALPGSEVLTSFRITGAEVSAAVLIRSGTPVNPDRDRRLAIREVFSIDRNDNVLQLTNFHRIDTYNGTVSADGQRVFFAASTNRLGSNPTENCQVFSIDRIGGDLRQLTDFHEGPRSPNGNGCGFGRPPLGCIANFIGRDIRSDAVVFYSSCDPFSSNPYGTQLFAMHPDGTGLRQVTTTQGYTKDASGAVTVELPFPFAYPGYVLRNQTE